VCEVTNNVCEVTNNVCEVTNNVCEVTNNVCEVTPIVCEFFRWIMPSWSLAQHTPFRTFRELCSFFSHEGMLTLWQNGTVVLCNPAPSFLTSSGAECSLDGGECSLDDARCSLDRGERSLDDGRQHFNPGQLQMQTENHACVDGFNRTGMDPPPGYDLGARRALHHLRQAPAPAHELAPAEHKDSDDDDGYDSDECMYSYDSYTSRLKTMPKQQTRMTGTLPPASDNCNTLIQSTLEQHILKQSFMGTKMHAKLPPSKLLLEELSLPTSFPLCPITPAFVPLSYQNRERSDQNRERPDHNRERSDNSWGHLTTCWTSTPLFTLLAAYTKSQPAGSPAGEVLGTVIRKPSRAVVDCLPKSLMEELM
jgi:hypothetical protein